MPTTRKFWAVAYWGLFAAWVLGAVLNMGRVYGGFLTNYLADLAFPPWFYIQIRGLSRLDGSLPKLLLVGDWFGRSRGRAALSIFLVGALAEGKTYYWPQGPLSGTYDTMDILAYAAGLIACYFLDRPSSSRSPN